MEFCRGGRLPERQRLSHEMAARVALQMVSAIAHIHAHGVTHRDLKLSNFLLSRPLTEPDAAVVLIDFSMATRVRYMSLPCGSVHYVAPEAFRGVHGKAR